jgi:tetratricopeptide (TPR) repeat protein
MKCLLPLLLIACLTQAAHAEPGALEAAKHSLQDALNHGDGLGILKARAGFEALSNADPKSAALHVWVATADWRAVPLLEMKEMARGARYAKDGLAECEAALALDAGNGDALALKGILQGMSIAFDAGSAMTLGPQSSANLQRALAVSPQNPRVWLLAGITTLQRPLQYGGGAEAAEPILARAAALFAADTTRADPAAAASDWGRDDAALWLGRAAMTRKDYAAAKARYREALAVNPDNGWVRTALLPEAEKALAAAGKP